MHVVPDDSRRGAAVRRTDARVAAEGDFRAARPRNRHAAQQHAERRGALLHRVPAARDPPPCAVGTQGGSRAVQDAVAAGLTRGPVRLSSKAHSRKSISESVIGSRRRAFLYSSALSSKECQPISTEQHRTNL
ncbi:hypothetical protein BCEP4_220223 [Burkholderia cepacia]|nr:hypothetical protein BCEP4_220223 [Burkholderia cepacia]